MGDVNCPHCGTELEITYDDKFECCETREDELQCNECEQNFILTTTIEFHYEARKTDRRATLEEE